MWKWFSNAICQWDDTWRSPTVWYKHWRWMTSWMIAMLKFLNGHRFLMAWVLCCDVRSKVKWKNNYSVSVNWYHTSLFFLRSSALIRRSNEPMVAAPTNSGTIKYGIGSCSWLLNKYFLTRFMIWILNGLLPVHNRYHRKPFVLPKIDPTITCW